MKFLFVTYRWGNEITGGAEIHHQRLAHDLIELGHEVEVWTTTGREIEAVAHWGVMMHDGFEAGQNKEDGIEVRRFPLDSVPRTAVALACKYLQRRLEKIPATETLNIIETEILKTISVPFLGLWTGWHYPESNGGIVTRWSSAQSVMLLKTVFEKGLLCLSGSSPDRKTLALFCDGNLIDEQEVEGSFFVQFNLTGLKSSGNRLELKASPVTRPLRDHRTLGIYLSEVCFKAESTELLCNIQADYRDYARRFPELWWKAMEERMEYQTPTMSRLFDWVRGPRSRALKSALSSVPNDIDLVVACNFPWSIIPMVASNCTASWAAMALWHLDDEFYFWKHYTESLKKAQFVLANTPYSSQQFFEPRGMKAPFVGPGIPELRDKPVSQDLGDGDTLSVLTVCRKSLEKRYDLIVEAVQKLRGDGVSCELVFIGPDADQKSLPDWVDYRGRVSDEELDAAYHNCDVFVLMSESESFGMVLAEAWLREKPVVANRVCGPAASLIDVGNDGEVAGDADELAAVLKQLGCDPDKRRRMGKMGRQKTEDQFVQRAATNRFLNAVEESLSSSKD